MSSPMAVAPLVPRTKATKKKRPGFRPVGKAKGSKLSKPSIASIKVGSKKASETKTSDSTAPKKRLEPSASNEADPLSSPGKTGETQTKPATKKRRQSTTISLGIGRKSAAQRKGAELGSGAESNALDASAEAGTSRNATVVSPATPAQASQDQDILEKLATEEPEAIRLNAFCSSFKGPKRPAPAKTQTTTPIKRANPAQTTKKSTTESTGAPAVQVIDGEIRLQESSLVFPGQRRTVQEVEEDFQEVVEEDAQLAIVGASYNSFVTRKGPQHWTVKETKRFYEALRQLGTDFCSMEAFFEDRTRKQLKRKYQAELTRNPKLVDLALDPSYQTDIDLSVFNVEVDPKAIEAAANDEPPPYIPTDGEDKQADGSVGQGAKKSGGTAEEWGEVIEEDAEAEKQAEAALATENHSLWPSYGEESEPLPEEHEVNFPEPSMDDFFHENDDDPTGGDMDVDPTPTPKEPEVSAAPSISLVPKKSTTKSKRPNFRTKLKRK